VASDIGKFGLYSAIIILLVLLARFSIEKGIDKAWDSSKDLKELISYFILSITVIVVAIPEGLPLSVTLSLAVSVKQMLTDNNLVRKMEACETMGGANNICSDKTGTLTMNKMTLTQLWNGSTIDIDSHKESLSFEEISDSIEWSELLKIGTCVNSTANLLPEEKGSST
jgi:P-type Ca2+ transporter type 2B